MTPDERAAIEAAVKACLEWECPTCKDVRHVDFGWVENDNWLDEEDRWIPCPTCGGNGAFRERVGIVAAMLSPLFAERNERIAEAQRKADDFVRFRAEAACDRDMLREALAALNTQAVLVEAWLKSRKADPNSEWGRLLSGLRAGMEKAYAALGCTRSIPAALRHPVETQP